MADKNRVDTDLIMCPVCEAVNVDNGEEIVCHRCESKIYRHPNIGTSVTWALLLAAIFLYIPANLYPVLEVKTIFSHTSNTIIGGVFALWDEGSYAVAVIILVASVFVPILKFILLIYLLISVKHPISESKELRHKIYYLIEFVGSWSMIDVFVVSILTGLVKYSSFKIIAGIGATSFVLMVFFMMLAAISFDPRLIRYATKEKKEDNR